METQHTDGDLTNSANVLRELLDEDHQIRVLFDQHFHEDLKRLAETIALSVAAFVKLNEVVKAKDGGQSAVVGGIILGAIDHIVVSTKLLVTGKFFPAGNLMRTAIECIAFACLCASPKPVYIKARRGTGKGAGQDKEVTFWRGYIKREPYTRGDLVMGHLGNNHVRLGISKDDFDALKNKLKHRHQFSHAGTFSTAATFTLAGQVLIGGHFDPEKLDGYRKEFADRIGLTAMLTPLIEHFTRQLA